ncbi:hypothetical protein Desor_5157 [Desulfosporosinus orientis DSM 765]|uniref:DUF5658 domain-containing protein n=1 Tax=Desulfosporosinus orientis (strain ATCC 19365 / DSM 765 / NCIMB 8382 / VKM B-1628 / Singapore I) TaxID=768706 RepID=G7W738_DESOD|nr:hypothetical protein [Desulfosporosinus orientis]AET70546.1 hypothetical protein Desor_5157 [Desulfosporosinus orientis DSM 765]
MHPSFDRTSSQQITLKHSLLGISSFAIAIFADVILVMSIFSKMNPNYNGISLSGTWYWVLIAASSILATVDLNKQNRKKLLPKLALIFGAGVIGAVCIVAALMGL